MSAGDNRLPILAAKIKRAVADARGHAGASLACAIKAGERLTEAKQHVVHGEWLPWLRDNCEISERTAQQYMRLARHKELVDVKSAVVADLTLSAAVDEITEPKPSAKLPEIEKAILDLPDSGHVKFGLRENIAGWDEIWIAPSSQHPGFFYVTHIWTPKDGANTSLVGSRKPARADFVETLIDLHLFCNRHGMQWRNDPQAPWPVNILLFADTSRYIEKLGVHAEDIREIVDIAEGRIDPDNPTHLKARARPGRRTPHPLCALVFGKAEVAP